MPVRVPVDLEGIGTGRDWFEIKLFRSVVQGIGSSQIGVCGIVEPDMVFTVCSRGMTALSLVL